MRPRTTETGCLMLGGGEFVRALSRRLADGGAQVEHADGTIATYNVLEPGSVCVKLGDTVYPDTPLALVGSFDGTQYRVALTLHYITDRIFAKGNAYSYEHAFESVFINPVFATADGNRMLVSQNRYTAVVAPELITKEMTKREMKARTEK